MQAARPAHIKSAQAIIPHPSVVGGLTNSGVAMLTSSGETLGAIIENGQAGAWRDKAQPN
jgi:hypothetical protein